MDRLNQPADQLVKILAACVKVASSPLGRLLAAGASVINFFSSEAFAFAVVGAGIFLDAFFGSMVSLKNGTFILSKLSRITFFKITAYGSSLVMVFLLEKLAHDAGFFGVKVVAGWALACEFWSMSASILILWPEAVFFRIMRVHLRGEIAAKLGASVDDILPDEKKL